MEENIKALADAIYADKVRRARQMTPAQRMAMGPALHAQDCERRKAQLRIAHPMCDEDEIRGLLIAQLRAEKEREEKGIYIKLPARRSDGIA